MLFHFAMSIRNVFYNNGKFIAQLIFKSYIFELLAAIQFMIIYTYITILYNYHILGLLQEHYPEVTNYIYIALIYELGHH